MINIRKRIMMLLLLGFFSLTSLAQEFKDYSNMENGTPLSGLLLNASEVKYKGNTNEEILGSKESVSKFKVESKMVVLTQCDLQKSNMKYDSTVAVYDMYIMDDAEHTMHDRFVNDIYAYWNEKDEDYLDDFKYQPASKHLFYNDGNYVLYDIEEIIPEKSSYTFWANGKIIKVTFKGYKKFQNKSGLPDFLAQVIKFKFEEKEIKPDCKSTFPPKEFLTMYEKGAFQQ